jgi:hypothetical protein
MARGFAEFAYGFSHRMRPEFYDSGSDSMLNFCVGLVELSIMSPYIKSLLISYSCYLLGHLLITVGRSLAPSDSISTWISMNVGTLFFALQTAMEEQRNTAEPGAAPDRLAEEHT